ncbi:hypothetical protein V8C86DRAFT_2549278 [Haematococcus lacustris]
MSLWSRWRRWGSQACLLMMGVAAASIISCPCAEAAEPPPPQPPSLLFVPRPPSPPTPPPSLFQPSPDPPLSPGAVLPRTRLVIQFFGLDLWSMVVSNSTIAELAARAGLTLNELTAPPSCYSSLLAQNYTALLGTPLPALQLMPGVAAFADDVVGLMEDYLQDRGVEVQLSDFCAGSRTNATFFVAPGPGQPRQAFTTLWPTLNVTLDLVAQPAWQSSFASSGMAGLSLRSLQTNWWV